MTNPIVVRLTKAVDSYPKGTELGFESVAKATSLLGEGAFVVDRHQDGSTYEAPRAARSSTSTTKAETADTASEKKG